MEREGCCALCTVSMGVSVIFVCDLLRHCKFDCAQISLEKSDFVNVETYSETAVKEESLLIKPSRNTSSLFSCEENGSVMPHLLSIIFLNRPFVNIFVETVFSFRSLGKHFPWQSLTDI